MPDMQNEAFQLGVHSGWDAANFGEAYGHTETIETEAARRSVERFPTDPEQATEWVNGFLVGTERFKRGEWQDGSPQDDDDVDPNPEIRIAVTDMDGTVIDTVECTKDDLRREIQRNPHGLLSNINENLIR